MQKEFSHDWEAWHDNNFIASVSCDGNAYPRLGNPRRSIYLSFDAHPVRRFYFQGAFRIVALKWTRWWLFRSLPLTFLTKAVGDTDLVLMGFLPIRRLPWNWEAEYNEQLYSDYCYRVKYKGKDIYLWCIFRDNYLSVLIDCLVFRVLKRKGMPNLAYCATFPDWDSLNDNLLSIFRNFLKV